MIKRFLLLLIIIFIVSSVSCSSGDRNPDADITGVTTTVTEPNEKDEKISFLEKELAEKDALLKNAKDELGDLRKELDILESNREEPHQNSNSLLFKCIAVMEAIEAGDMETLALHVHPNKGVRFSPYPYISIQQDLVFTSTEVAGLFNDGTVMNWGNYDGSGFPIDLAFEDYYQEFIYDQDYINPHIIGNNAAVSSGNMINNLRDVYPVEYFIEFHFTGFDSQYEGIDWKSLTIVFEELNGDYFLVGVIHGQWTI